jgi:uncharacterized protein (TIRG00374 family)
MVDFHHMGLTLASVQPHLVVAGLLAMLLNYCLKTYRWASILWVQRPDISLGQLARFNFVSIFLGNFLPTSISSDIVRIYYVSQRTADPRAAISSIFADRIIGTFSVAIATIVAFLVLNATGLFPIGSVVSYGVVALLLLSLGVPLVLQRAAVIDGIRLLLDRFTGRKLFEDVKDMSEHLLLYRNRPAVIAKALAVAFLNLFIAVLEFYLVAKGFSAQISIGYFFLFIPLVIFLSMLPVSIGGIGLVEAGLVFFFSKVGMPIETCIGTALLYRALQLTCLLPGAAIYLFDGFSVRELSA